MKQTLIAILLFTGISAYAQQSKYPKLYRLLRSRMEFRKATSFLKFYERNLPDLLKQVERDMPKNLDKQIFEEDSEVPDDWSVVERILHMTEFYLEYIEVVREEPGEAKRMLLVGKLELSLPLYADKLREYRKSSNKTAATRAEARLQVAVEKLFDLNLQIQEEEFEWQKRELQKLEETIRKRKQYREKIIKAKLLELTEGEDVLEF